MTRVGLVVRVVYVDDDMIDVAVPASNGTFAGACRRMTDLMHPPDGPRRSHSLCGPSRPPSMCSCSHFGPCRAWSATRRSSTAWHEPTCVAPGSVRDMHLRTVGAGRRQRSGVHRAADRFGHERVASV